MARARGVPERALRLEWKGLDAERAEGSRRDAEKKEALESFWETRAGLGAGDRDRTDDVQLGKLNDTILNIEIG